MDKGQITDLHFNLDSSFNLDLTESGQQTSIPQGFFLPLPSQLWDYRSIPVPRLFLFLF